MSTTSEDIRIRIKQIIANVAGLNPSRIGDDSTLRDDLKLDSLSLLEIGVDVDYAFQLGLPDERFKEVRSIPDMVALVSERLEELAVGAQAASA